MDEWKCCKNVLPSLDYECGCIQLQIALRLCCGERVLQVREQDLHQLVVQLRGSHHIVVLVQLGQLVICFVGHDDARQELVELERHAPFAGLPVPRGVVEKEPLHQQLQAILAELVQPFEAAGEAGGREGRVAVRVLEVRGDPEQKHEVVDDVESQLPGPRASRLAPLAAGVVAKHQHFRQHEHGVGHWSREVAVGVAVAPGWAVRGVVCVCVCECV